MPVWGWVLLILGFSIISQVIIEKRAHCLVEDYVISCYNHPARGDYNTEALVFKIATTRFLIFLEKRKRKYICSDSHLSNYTETCTIILLRLSEYYGIIPSTLFHNIHFAFGQFLLNTYGKAPTETGASVVLVPGKDTLSIKCENT